MAWGLVDWVVPLEQLESAALELARQLASNAPLAMRVNKRVLRELLRAEGTIDPDV